MEKIWLPGIARFLESLKKTIRFPPLFKRRKNMVVISKERAYVHSKEQFRQEAV